MNKYSFFFLILLFSISAKAAGLADTSTSVITATPISIIADSVSTSSIIVQLKDVNSDNLIISGGVVALSSSLGTLTEVTDLTNGSYSATLTSTSSVGTATLTATLDGV